GVSITGRLASDTNGTLTMPVNRTAGGGTYNIETSPADGYQRWGDYTTVVVDASDNMTLWSFQEYANATNSWGVLASKILAPLPATPSSASPSSGAAGSTVSITITGTSSGGSGFYDPGSS